MQFIIPFPLKMDSATIDQTFNRHLLIQESKMEYSKTFYKCTLSNTSDVIQKKKTHYSHVYRRKKYRMIFNTL